MFRALYAHHQEIELIDAASGIVTLSKWPSGEYRTYATPGISHSI